jgi:hypothetical protein
MHRWAHQVHINHLLFAFTTPETCLDLTVLLLALFTIELTVPEFFYFLRTELAHSSSLERKMALVLSPWFGRGCGRRTRPFSFGSPSLFTDLVIVKVPQMQRQVPAPVQGRRPAMSNARVVQWAETADLHVFKLRLPGLCQ